MSDFLRECMERLFALELAEQRRLDAIAEPWREYVVQRVAEALRPGAKLTLSGNPALRGSWFERALPSPPEPSHEGKSQDGESEDMAPGSDGPEQNRA
jgi:hypothetical protein